MKTFFSRSACLGVVVLTALTGVKATAAEMDLNTVFSDGATPPFSLTTPWLEYRVENLGPNSALFTLTATNMTETEKIGGFYFNFDDTLSLANLNFSAPIVNSGLFTTPTISKSVNNYKADGDGKYDILLSFDTSGGLPAYFGNGDSLSYTLTYTGIGTMADSSFAFLSLPAGGWGPYYAAAHIQATPAGGGGSAWLAATAVTYPSVPEPSSAALVVAALMALGLRRVRA